MLRLCAILVLLSLSAPAQADWQNTKWGMSPAEVKTVVRQTWATSTKEKLDLAYANHGGPDLKATYLASGMVFDAYFYFAAGEKLTRVVLALKDKHNAEKVLLIADAQYKKPRAESERRSADSLCRYIQKTWDDQAKNNEVTAYISFCVSGDHSANMIYSMPAQATETGL